MPESYQDGQRPCEECGTMLEVGLEPVSPADDPESWEAGETEWAVDWCPNLDCPSNHVLPGLTRTGANRYICTTCGAELTGPMGDIFRHRRAHGPDRR